MSTDKEVIFDFLDVREWWHLHQTMNKDLFTYKDSISQGEVFEYICDSPVEVIEVPLKRVDNIKLSIKDLYYKYEHHNTTCVKLDSEEPKEESKEESNNVNHPSHYTDGKIEVIEYIEDKKFGYCLGNAIKYISRAGKKNKDKEIEDLQKAIWYIERRIKELKEE